MMPGEVIAEVRHGTWFAHFLFRLASKSGQLATSSVTVLSRQNLRFRPTTGRSLTNIGYWF